jgi:hypothetical protein
MLEVLGKNVLNFITAKSLLLDVFAFVNKNKKV